MKKILIALLSGFILALGWPTYGFPLLLFFGFIPLLYIDYKIRKSTVKHKAWQVFGLAYLGFFVWNIITTYWLYYSTAAGMVFAILANTLLMSLVFILYHHIAKRTKPLFSFIFLPALWICFEYLHLHWDFSWPWLNLGNGFSEFPQWVQWYEYTGSFGGTLWIWAGNLIGFSAILSYQNKQKKKCLKQGVLPLVLLIAVPIIISYTILNNYTSEKSQKSTEVLILQPDIDPYAEKYNTNDEQIGQLLNQMVDKHIGDSTTLVIAPETVFADGTRRSQFDHSAAHHYGEQIIQKHPNVSFLGGITLYDIIHDESQTNPQSNFVRPGYWYNGYNAAFMLSAQYENQFYNKSKLVVGVENFPYQSVLKPLLGNIMIDLGGTVSKLTTQSERSVFNFGHEEKVAPIICYESVYGKFVTDYVKNGAEFLAVITNDAWWGNTQGHKQHVSYARLRAIETRRDVAQSANNGTSAIINQKGEIIKSTAYDVRAILKGKIHLNNSQTFYVKHGDYLAVIAEILVLLILVYVIFMRLKQRLKRN